MQQKILAELEEARQALEKFIGDPKNIASVNSAAIVMIEAIKAGNKLISCGNGGSMSDAMHFAEELSGRFRGDRKALPAIAISDSSHITCAANDYGFDHIYSRFVEGLGQAGDVLLAISTSGNSVNIINAAEAAHAKGMKVVALTGKEGGKLASIADVEIRAPKTRYSDRVQEIHIKVIHILIHCIESGLSLD
jgi:D-sedoheptulose 7-phosphate isomerase